MSDKKSHDSEFKRKAAWSVAVMQKIHYVGLGFMVPGIVLLSTRGWSMLWFIVIGAAIIFFSLVWATFYWDCPNCGENLRAVRSILSKANYCPYCGQKL